MNDLISLQELAANLRVSTFYLKNLVKKTGYEFVRKENRLYFPKKNVKALFSSRDKGLKLVTAVYSYSFCVNFPFQEYDLEALYSTHAENETLRPQLDDLTGRLQFSFKGLSFILFRTGYLSVTGVKTNDLNEIHGILSELEALFKPFMRKRPVKL